MPRKTLEEIYKKKTPYEHILDRPDTYIGSIEPDTDYYWIYDNESNKIINKEIEVVPGLYKIIDEVFNNSRDQCFVDGTTTKNIYINIDQSSSIFNVKNDGNGIDIAIHKEHNVYIPEMIFGHLLTSTNYDDNIEKITGGKNGYGAKLANIFSLLFRVETVDSQRKKIYTQLFKNNMLEKDEPDIKRYTKKPYTDITFKPDLSKFGINELTDDFISLIKRRSYDIAATTPKNVNVYFNEEKILVKNFKDYISLYLGNGQDFIYQEVNERWQVAVAFQTNSNFEQVSFVNGISTNKGGTHVNHVVTKIVNGIKESIKKKDNDVNIKPAYIKEHIWVFVNSLIVNPSFSSQTKSELTTKANKFGSECDLPALFVNKLIKTGLLNEILMLARFKENKNLKKTDGRKGGKIKGITKLEDAEWAKSKNSSRTQQCSLFITEGDSAATFAIAGLSVVGRQKYGVFPLKGKLLNPREKTIREISNNEELNNLKKILGLKEGEEYEDTKSLRYGSVIMLTDADDDGIHISGLFINMIHVRWPSLLKIPGFIKLMITPVVKITKGKEIKEFYSSHEFDIWKNNNSMKGWIHKYYKGLGTSTAKEAKEYFRELDKLLVNFHWDKYSDKFILLAFGQKLNDQGKKYTDVRKKWLENMPANSEIERGLKDITYSEYINEQLIHFSWASVVRAIPALADGLKPSQRKILFGALKKNVTKKTEVRVSQLAGYISENTGYHHGEKSLHDTIIHMAQDFIGSNNINFLFPNGGFGTRRKGGKDSASPRYIYTYLEPITRQLFMKEDDPILEHLKDDNDIIEPKWYMPILPNVLINSSSGIGTGFSTDIPCFNVNDIIDNIYRLMDKKKLKTMKPWYYGFTGKIEKIDNKKYVTKGIWERTDNTTILITELPIGEWILHYKDFLENSIVEKNPNAKHFLKDFSDSNTTHTKIEFKLTFYDKKTLDRMIKNVDMFESTLKLVSTVNYSNIHLFDTNGLIKRYSSPNDVMDDFYKIRLEYYDKRKEYLLDLLNRKVIMINARIRFILMLIDEEIIIKGKQKIKIEKILEKNDFPKLMYAGKDESYDYLMTMPLWNLTEEKIKELKKEKNCLMETLHDLEDSSLIDLWKNDIEIFRGAYDEYLEDRTNRDNEIVKKKRLKRK